MGQNYKKITILCNKIIAMATKEILLEDNLKVLFCNLFIMIVKM